MTRILRFKNQREFEETMGKQARKRAIRQGLATPVERGEHGCVRGSARDAKPPGSREAAPDRVLNKFNAKKSVVDGITFDSKREAKRYLLLKAKEKSGVIRNLEVQKPLELIVAREKIATLIVDFFYQERDGVLYERGDPVAWEWRDHFEDVKGYKRSKAYEVFRLKKKLAEVLYRITIEEV